MPVLVVRPDEYRVAASDVLSWWRPNVALMWGLPARQTWDLCAGRGIPYLLFIRYWHLLNPPPYIDLLTDPIDPNHHAEHHGLFGHAANVVVNAEHVARVVQRIHGVSSSVSYVPVDPLPRRSPASAKRYVTVINARKGGGGKLVAHLARVNPDVQFLLIDRDDTDYPSNVHTRSYDDRPYNVMLDDTKVLLFPFDEEPCGTGRVVLEAYHLGVPVLAPRRGGIPEVVPNPHLIDESNDLTAWSTALRALLADYDRATSLVTQQAQLFGPSEQLEVITELVSHFHNGFKS